MTAQLVPTVPQPHGHCDGFPGDCGIGKFCVFSVTTTLKCLGQLNGNRWIIADTQLATISEGTVACKSIKALKELNCPNHAPFHYCFNTNFILIVFTLLEKRKKCFYV